jgi:hypothetical protein
VVVHGAFADGSGWSQMLSTYIVESGQPLATFVDGPPAPPATPDKGTTRD